MWRDLERKHKGSVDRTQVCCSPGPKGKMWSSNNWFWSWNGEISESRTVQSLNQSLHVALILVIEWWTVVWKYVKCRFQRTLWDAKFCFVWNLQNIEIRFMWNPVKCKIYFCMKSVGYELRVFWILLDVKFRFVWNLHNKFTMSLTSVFKNATLGAQLPSTLGREVLPNLIVLTSTF